MVANVDVRDCAFASLSVQALFLRGLNAANPVTDVTLANCRFPNSGANFYSNTNRINLINNQGGGL
jgi:hypothetical protein